MAISSARCFAIHADGGDHSTINAKPGRCNYGYCVCITHMRWDCRTRSFCLSLILDYEAAFCLMITYSLI